MARRDNDFYPTPSWATKVLLDHEDIRGEILECAAGDRDMARVLCGRNRIVYTNDIDKKRSADTHFDASSNAAWALHNTRHGRANWVVTNPPFSVADLIVPAAYLYARTGIAMMLRLSYLEPTKKRGTWLNKYPPTKLIVLPRISFTGDGKTDNVTCAWMIWHKDGIQRGTIISENPKFASVAPRRLAA